MAISQPSSQVRDCLPLVLASALLLTIACKRNDPMKNASDTVEIVPGKSIGALRLGTKSAELPATAKMQGGRGELEGILFVLGDDGSIQDIWIADLRVFPTKLVMAQREVPTQAPLAELQRFFGGCVEVEGIKGGRFYNCSTGVALGCPWDGSDGFVQLRINPR